MLLSSSCWVVVLQSLGSHPTVSSQPSGSCQETVRQLPGSCQAVIRQAGSGWKNESMVSGDPGRKLFSKQGTGKGTNWDIASGDRRGHSPITIIFRGWKGDNPRLSPFSGAGKGTALSMVLSSLVYVKGKFLLFNFELNLVSVPFVCYFQLFFWFSSHHHEYWYQIWHQKISFNVDLISKLGIKSNTYYLV
jgi:hypothetical protein